MKPSQPSDEWTFLTDDEAEERLDVPPELAALHAEEELTPAEDPGRADVLLAEDDPAAPRVYFDDEDPDLPGPGRGPGADGDGPEPDLEDVLESQHYAFTDEGEDGDEG